MVNHISVQQEPVTVLNRFFDDLESVEAAETLLNEFVRYQFENDLITYAEQLKYSRLIDYFVTCVENVDDEDYSENRDYVPIHEYDTLSQNSYDQLQDCEKTIADLKLQLETMKFVHRALYKENIELRNKLK